MKKIFLAGLTVIALLIATGAAATYWQFRDAFNVDDVPFADLHALLEPYTEIYLPEDDGPVPAILFFHGCGGVGQLPGPRTDQALAQGFAALVMDSHTPRGVDWRRVCDGKVLHGAERAGDVLVALEIARAHPRIDSQKLFLAGFSHGGWTVLEALAFDATLPPGLSNSPGNHLEGVLAAVAWYPYCGFPARFAGGWDVDIPVFMPLAELDETTAPEPCEAVSRAQAEGGKPVRHITYPGVSHGFDEIADWVKFYDPDVHAEAAREQYALFQSVLANDSH